jgi:hypothetical protein
MQSEFSGQNIYDDIANIVAFWRLFFATRALSLKADGQAYALLIDRSGTICWMNSGAFSDSTYGLLKAKAFALLQPYP